MFAAMAMQGILSNPALFDGHNDIDIHDTAISVTKELIKKLNKERFSDQEIELLSLEKYGNDINRFGGQRDGFIEGFKQALKILGI